MRKGILIVAVLALFVGTANAGILWDNNQNASANEVLWDNDIVPNGFSGRAISPPLFPDIRVADDFIVPDGETWWIKDAHFNIIEDAGWTHGGQITVTFYDDVNNFPGAVIAERVVEMQDGKFERMDTGDEYFGRADFDYWAAFNDQIELDGGKYWIGIRNDLGAGAGTNYWMTSKGGPDGMDSKTGAFSLDAGNSWQDEGAGWHHAFTITGIPEPASLLLLGLGGLAILRRRR